MVINTITLLEKLAITIDSDDGEHLGSGTLLRIRNDFYVLTAAHCLFDNETLELDSSVLKINNKEYGQINLVKQVLVNPSVDAIFLKVSPEQVFKGFPDILFTDDYLFPSLYFCFRGKPKTPSGNSYTVYNCSVNGRGDNGLINLSIPSPFYTDFKGETGAGVLDGFSGSGLIIENHQQLYFCAMVHSVSEDNFCGVDCIAISDIEKVCPVEMDIVEDLPDTSETVQFDVDKLRREITKEIIKSAEDSDNVAVKNLKRKMDLFSPDWDQEELENFISDMLTWDVLYKEKVKGNSNFEKLINESKVVLSAGNKKYIVNSSAEGNKYFHEIRKEFREIVKSFLEKHDAWSRYINTVSNGEIAKYLANCNLDFKE
ncbi:hypothetical protein [Alteromonas sp. BMJM2]|uniref:hypothetical protein n=1 Tax=Alteromonas sp. BMJM2 TaxID=2954241 RepID=UPI0022B4B0A1|nr:hypothetical protein [Alteromonas sp. BMJM2]